MIERMGRQLSVYIVMAFWSVFGGTPQFACSDILFLNLNAATFEVQAARESARKTGQKLLVVPETIPSTQEYKKLDELEQQTQKISARRIQIGQNLEKYNCEKLSPNDVKSIGPLCQAYAQTADEMKEIGRREAAILEKHKFSVEKLRSVFEKQKKRSGDRITSIILSGHSAGESFTGLLGSLDRRLLEREFEVAGIKDQLKSLYLWGCYTGRPINILSWQNTFPSIDLVVGMNGQGPNDELGHTALGGLIENESRIRNTEQTKRILELLQTSGNLNQTVASALIGNCFLEVASGKVSPILSALGSCTEAYNYLSSANRTLFASALLGQFNLYPNLNSELRTFYSTLIGSQSCAAHPEHADEWKKFPTKNAVLAVLHAPLIQKRYLAYYADEIQALNQFLRTKSRCGALRIQESMPRWAALAELKRVHVCYKGLVAESEDPDVLREQGRYQSFFKNSGCTFIEMSGVPLSWNIEGPFDLDDPRNTPSCNSE